VHTRQEYNELVARMYDKFPNVDKSGKNPSRLSRYPNVMRDGGSLQELWAIEGRVPRAKREKVARP